MTGRCSKMQKVDHLGVDSDSTFLDFEQRFTRSFFVSRLLQRNFCSNSFNRLPAKWKCLPVVLRLVRGISRNDEIENRVNISGDRENLGKNAGARLRF